MLVRHREAVAERAEHIDHLPRHQLCERFRALADDAVDEGDAALLLVDGRHADRAAQCEVSREDAQLHELPGLGPTRDLRRLADEEVAVRRELLLCEDLRVAHDFLWMIRQGHHHHLHSPGWPASRRGGAHA